MRAEDGKDGGFKILKMRLKNALDQVMSHAGL